MNVYLFLALFFIIIGILSYSFFIEPNCLVIHKNQIKVQNQGKPYGLFNSLIFI